MPVFVCIYPYASHYNGWLLISLRDQKESTRLQHGHDNRKALSESLLLLNIPPTVAKTILPHSRKVVSDTRYNP